MPALRITSEFLATPHRFLVHEPTGTAILSDLHVGLEASLAQAGISMPEVYGAAMARQWGQLVASGPRRVIIAGDFFDDAAAPEAAVKVCRELLSALKCPVTVIPGNHDPDADSMRELLGCGVVPFVRLGDALISHGHDTTLEEAAARGGATWVVGHQHPALILATRVQRAKMACYAVCETGTRPGRLVLLPAFSPGPLGSNLAAAGNWLLPVERPRDEDVQIFGIIESKDRAGQVLPFGPLSMHVAS